MGLYCAVAPEQWDFWGSALALLGRWISAMCQTPLLLYVSDPFAPLLEIGKINPFLLHLSPIPILDPLTNSKL